MNIETSRRVAVQVAEQPATYAGLLHRLRIAEYVMSHTIDDSLPTWFKSETFHLPGKHDQGTHGRLRPGDIAGLAQPPVVEPKGHAPTVHNVKPGAKAVPAHVWHKNEDGTVVAESFDGFTRQRIAWDDGLGRYIVQTEVKKGEWVTQPGTLGKQKAYDKIKSGNWVQPHTQHEPVQTSKTLTPGKELVAPPKTKAEMPSPGAATKQSTHEQVSPKATITFEPDGTPALNAEQKQFVVDTLKKHGASGQYSSMNSKYDAVADITKRYPELSMADVGLYLDKHHNTSTTYAHIHSHNLKYYLKVHGKTALFGKPTAKPKKTPAKKVAKKTSVKKTPTPTVSPSNKKIGAPPVESVGTLTPEGKVKHPNLFFAHDPDAPVINEVTAKKMHNEMFDSPPPENALTTSQRLALKAYTGSSYMHMNECLRYGKNCTADVEKRIALANLGLRRTTRSFSVTRGASMSSLGGHDPATLVGKTITDKGFFSSSINPQRSFKGQVQYQVKVPKGTRGAYVKGFSSHAYEDEFLLAPGTKFKVRNVKKRPKRYVGDYDTWFVDVEVIIE